MISRCKAGFSAIDATSAWLLSALLLCSGAVSIYADEPHPSRAVVPGEGVTDADLKRWIEQLGSAIAAEREGAVRSLIAAGPRAMPAVRPALESNDREVRARAEAVAIALERNAFEFLNDKPGAQVVYKPNPRPGVREATFGGTKLTVEDMQHLACLYRLEFLGIRDSEITDASFRYVGQLRTLHTLGLYSEDAATGKVVTSAIDITDEGLKQLASLDRLTNFCVSGTRIRGEGFAALAQCPSLKSVGILKCPRLDESLVEGLEAFRNHKALSHLCITSCRVPKGVGEAISQITNLQWLCLEDTTITDDELRPLSALPKLQSLDVGYTQISDAGVAYLTKCPRLQRLQLHRTQITAAGVRTLTKYPQLQIVNLSWTKLRSADLRVLRHLATLKSLSTDGICEDEQQLQALQEALPGVGVGWDPQRSKPPPDGP